MKILGALLLFVLFGTNQAAPSCLILSETLSQTSQRHYTLLQEAGVVFNKLEAAATEMSLNSSAQRVASAISGSLRTSDGTSVPLNPFAEVLSIEVKRLGVISANLGNSFLQAASLLPPAHIDTPSSRQFPNLAAFHEATESFYRRNPNPFEYPIEKWESPPKILNAGFRIFDSRLFFLQGLRFEEIPGHNSTNIAGDLRATIEFLNTEIAKMEYALNGSSSQVYSFMNSAEIPPLQLQVRKLAISLGNLLKEFSVN